MNKKALLVAVIIALVGAALGHLYLTRLEAEATGGRRVPVLIAAKDLKPGMVLTEGVLGIRPIPQAYVGRRNISAQDAKKVVGIRVSSQIEANEPVLWSDIATLSQPGRDLSSAVQDGKRALSISQTNTFDGLLRGNTCFLEKFPHRNVKLFHSTPPEVVGPCTAFKPVPCSIWPSAH